MKLLISNLKANLTQNEVDIYVEKLRHLPKNDFELIICPSYPFIKDFAKTDYSVGVQNISKYSSGAYTGEVTASQVASLNCKYVIIGHYERKIFFHEDNNDFVKKIRNAFNAGLKVIYCIGETKHDIESDQTLHILEEQIGQVLSNFTHEELKNVIIAYEPSYAIGTKVFPEIKDIESTIKFIKNLIYDYYELDLPIVYGGSIDRANIILLRKIKELSGYMIGNSSLNIEELERIQELSKIDKC